MKYFVYNHFLVHCGLHEIFIEKFNLWTPTCINNVFMLIWCNESFDLLILSHLDAYAWFEEAEHVTFLKLESWKKVCIFKWRELQYL